jgi:hypothetical protein
LLWSVVLLAAAPGVQAASADVPAPTILMASSRVYVTLVPRTAEPDEIGWLHGDAIVPNAPSLNLPLGSVRRNRLEFSITRTDVLVRGDHLRLRLASDAHVIAQLLSGGQFSDADDSWIAMLGIASRVRITYDLGPWELSISARRKFGDADVRARFGYMLRF